MAEKPFFILAVIFSLLFVPQVSSESKNNGDTSHVSQALHALCRGDRKLLYSLAFDLSKYFNTQLLGHPSGTAPVALAPAPSPSGQVDCGGLCEQRCRLHSRQNVCLRACGTCCVRCKCVPPGTYGNREMCGKCYMEMTTHGNKTKCP